MPALSKAEFRQLWPDQFWENFQGYPPGTDGVIESLVKRYAGPGTALDIGCGRGDLTNRLLVPNFGRVVALDLLEQPAKLDPSVQYHPVGDRDYSCSAIADASIDFVWSFGCFCHLPNSAVQQYLKSIRRVLKPDGVAVVMFANWPRHPLRRSIPDPERFREVADETWFYCDTETAQDMATAAGLIFSDLLPDFRDTLGELKA